MVDGDEDVVYWLGGLLLFQGFHVRSSSGAVEMRGGDVSEIFALVMDNLSRFRMFYMCDFAVAVCDETQCVEYRDVDADRYRFEEYVELTTSLHKQDVVQ